MNTYHKIQTVFYRDPATNHKTLLEGTWSKPEFEYLQNALWLVDEKIDGTNMRVQWNGTNVSVKGKTDAATRISGLYQNIEEFFTPDKMAAHFGSAQPDSEVSVCLYGEGYGPGIQSGGGNYRKDKGFILFDVRIGNTWLQREDVKVIAAALGCDAVPELGVMTLNDAIALVKTRFNSTFGDFEAEGIIARPLVEMFNRRGERIITKLKCRDYDTIKQYYATPH